VSDFVKILKIPPFTENNSNLFVNEKFTILRLVSFSKHILEWEGHLWQSVIKFFKWLHQLFSSISDIFVPLIELGMRNFLAHYPRARQAARENGQFVNLFCALLILQKKCQLRYISMGTYETKIFK